MQPQSYPKADNLLIFVGENHFGSMLTRIFMVLLRLRPVRIEREEAKGRESKEQVAKWPNLIYPTDINTKHNENQEVGARFAKSTKTHSFDSRDKESRR